MMNQNESIDLFPLSFSGVAIFLESHSQLAGFFAASLSIVYTSMKIIDHYKNKKQKTKK
jgi:hypothetical protein